MDIELSYIEEGSGFPLVLLHGNDESNEYFSHQIPYFKEYFRVVAPDTRGHGKSPRGEAPFTISQFADDLREFLISKNIIKAHILGFSDGANIALVFALKYPDMVEKLILNGADLDPSGVKRSVQFPIEVGYRIAKRAAKSDPKAKRREEMLGLMVNDPNIAPESLAKLFMPTLVIVGTNDMIKDSHSRLIASKIPNSTFKVIKGDHFIANKNPEPFNEEVRSFLLG
jgi:pimeloyl-ACP methyl ester carboxylesterase